MEEVVSANKVIVINDGEIVMQGTPEEIFKNKDKLIAIGLEIPLVARIADKLKENGINLPDGILTEEMLAEELCKLK